MYVIHNSRPCPALPRRSHPSVGPEIRSLQSFQRFTLQPSKQHVISSRDAILASRTVFRDENPVTATPLESALTNRDARNSFRIRSYANCRVWGDFSQIGTAPLLTIFEITEFGDQEESTGRKLAQCAGGLFGRGCVRIKANGLFKFSSRTCGVIQFLVGGSQMITIDCIGRCAPYGFF